MNDDELVEKQLSEHTLYAGKILTLRVDDALMPNGDVCKREYVHHSGGAAVLAIDRDGFAYFVRQFRYPYREVVLEIPAGKLERGESPSSAALRELEEEAGLVAKKLVSFGEIYPTPGYTDERLHIFFTDDFSFSRPNPDKDEFLNIVRIPFSDALAMTLRGEIKDSKTCYAILKASFFKMHDKM